MQMKIGILPQITPAVSETLIVFNLQSTRECEEMYNYAG